MAHRSLPLLAAVLSMSAAPAAANMAVFDPQSSSTHTQGSSTEPLQQFPPSFPSLDKRIEYSHWDEALRFMVIPMGPSVREGAPRVDPRTGSRRIYGHQSRYRLEGNRVAFSFLKDKQRTAVSQYRADLERIGSEIDLTRLSRNEQLAFWLNLHNVAVIEALAGIYPISEPSDGKFGPNRASLDDAELVTIASEVTATRTARPDRRYRFPPPAFWQTATSNDRLSHL